MDPDVSAAFNGSDSQSQTSPIRDPDVAAAFAGTPGLKQASPSLIASDRPLQGMGTVAVQTAGQILNAPGKALTGAAVKAGITNPYAAAAIGVLPDIAEDIGLGPFTEGGWARALKGGRIADNPVSSVNNPRSIGAAAASSNLATASPELQQAVTKAAQKTGGAVNPEALSRHVEADSLPVPMRLTAGQATQDPTQISLEQNMRGKNPDLAARFNEQNQQLTGNIQAVRDNVGPDVFSANPVEHGDTLIKAYQDKNSAAEADISAKYQALKDANGGQFPVDAKALLSNATNALHQGLLFDHAPTAVMSTLNRLADSGNMSFENYESLRTNLARIQRSSSDGNERAAAGVIRNSMEELPLQAGASNLKPLADTARAAAKAQFQALDADPAYKAAVNESVPPDRFVQKFITGPSATRDGVSTMQANLAHDPTATQTMKVAAVDGLKQASGIDQMGNGNFSQAGFNKTLQANRPKLAVMLDPKDLNDLDTLGNVARYTQFQPRGSFVNNSNTFVAQAANHMAGLAENVANVKAGGIPVGTWTRNALSARSTRKAVNQMLEPGAGLSKLSSLVNP